jgi:hypothetical protein
LLLHNNLLLLLLPLPLAAASAIRIALLTFTSLGFRVPFRLHLLLQTINVAIFMAYGLHPYCRSKVSWQRSSSSSSSSKVAWQQQQQQQQCTVLWQEQQQQQRQRGLTAPAAAVTQVPSFALQHMYCRSVVSWQQ